MLSYKLLFFLPLISTIFTYPFGVLLGEKTAQYFSSTLISIAAILSWFLFISFSSSSSSEIIIPVLEWFFVSGQFFNWGISVNSLTLLMLTLVLTVSALVHIYSIEYMSHDNSKVRFMTYLSLFTFCMVALVVSDNLIQLFFGWEGVGLASYLLIGFWHHKKSANLAAMKAFLVNRVADFGFLIGIATLYIFLDTLSINEIIAGKEKLFSYQINFLGFEINALIFSCFFLFIGAMGKSAQFGFHTWLPDAHVEAPTAGSILLAGVLLKVGAYGILRVSIPFFTEGFLRYQFIIAFLSVVGIIYGAIVAIVQIDIKKLIAYSSISHMGFVMLGISAGRYLSLEGAVIQMINHGITSGALFMLVGFLYDRRHTRRISDFGGLKKSMPMYAAIFLFTSFASIGLPGLNGFVGEFMILMGSYPTFKVLTSVAAFGVVLAAIYMLWAYQRMFNGQLDNDENSVLKDLSSKELVAVGPLLVLMLFIGIYPSFIESYVVQDVSVIYESINNLIGVSQ